MSKRPAFFLIGLLLLAGCSSSAPSEFPIAPGPLRPEEIPMGPFGQVSLAARVFDVVNQDQTAESNTGIAGRVQPMPVDILSAYAAAKFHANGGPYTARFVIKQASLQVHAVETPHSSSFWSFDFGGDQSKAELAVDLSVMLVATKADGTGTSITATTSQSQQTTFAGTPEEHRAVYTALMIRAMQALDGEFSRQLPVYFGNVVMH